MFEFKAVYDNLVTDDEISEEFKAETIGEADEIAQKHSRRTGLSAGNYELYIQFGGEWINTIEVLMAVEGR